MGAVAALLLAWSSGVVCAWAAHVEKRVCDSELALWGYGVATVLGLAAVLLVGL